MTSFGYLGVGLCGRCQLPNHLYVSSVEESQQARCVSCHGRYSDAEIERVPIESETANCQACGRPEFLYEGDDVHETAQKWKFLTAYLADQKSTIIVHFDCSTESPRSMSCVDCSTIYATTRYTDWRSSINTVGYMELTQIEGDQRCDTCTSNFYNENGGRHNYCSCPSCDDIFYKDNGYWYRDTLYCSSCYENYYYECNDCGTECWDGDGHHCEDEDEDDNNGSIHSYTYRPSPYFFGEGQYHLGFELEVEARNNSRYEGADLVQSALGAHAYMKDDGSLSDGFEVVTHPHTLEKYQKEFNWEFISRLKSQGYRSWNTDTCGLHVHVSRTAFGSGLDPWRYVSSARDQIILQRQAHELRFMKLIYDNQRQVERIAGRSNNNYATFQDKGRLVNKLKFGNQSSGRYSAINTENDATLEVRVFKGSLRKERVLSALEFVAASVEYTRDLKVTAKNQALSWLRFTAYVSENIDTYPNLALIMSESFASDTNPYEN